MEVVERAERLINTAQGDNSWRRRRRAERMN
jgi:hypothetical protein